ncbi:Zinc finger CCCH domain-containing protein [Actinidia chinensis var. chinensis]|uniref:Zinc finger CCCH domain-containing protein n=1 Tax=Actinidia chinensis var. chinensis TaxID=1590841 RepID=A0A2R6QDG9_ACTCC|nr:Zinc finger CCCH domain-containing protein [Actinidia chinensis var. chinensis]
MGWKIWQQSGAKQLLTQPFHLLTTTLLSLLLPLSFLLLARLSAAHYFFTQTQPQNSPLFFSLFLYTNPSLLPSLISLLTVATLIHGLTGQTTLLTESPKQISRPHLYVAWISLSILQVCVGFGIEGSIAAGIEGSGLGHETSLPSRVVFFLGLHETMLYWWRAVVKPVVDDSVFGFSKEERWVERVAVASSFGTLWWWRLRGEVESLVVVVEAKKELMMDIGVADFVGWWLYYLTVIIGTIRIVKVVMWFGVILLLRRVEVNQVDSIGNEEKV